MRRTISKKIISLFIILSMLFAVMVFQIGNAISAEFNVSNLTGENPYNSDYHLKTTKTFSNDELRSTSVYENTYNDDGSVNVVLTITAGENTSQGNLKKEYDQEGRLRSITTTPTDPRFSRITLYDYREDGSYNSYNRYIDDFYAQQTSTVYTTYDPDLNGLLDGNWSFEFDEKGRKTYMSTIDKYDDHYEYQFSYDEDEQGRAIKKYYTKTVNDSIEETGSVDISYSDDGKTLTESLTDDNGYSIICSISYNDNNQIIKISSLSTWSDGEEQIIEHSYSYDENGNLACDDYRVENSSLSVHNRTEYTYEYHPRSSSEDVDPVVTPELVSKSGNELAANTYTELELLNAPGSDYEYAFTVWNTTTEQWYLLQDYSDETTFNWYTGSAGKKNLYVDIRNKTDYDDVIRICLSNVNVAASDLAVSSFTSSEGTNVAEKSYTTLEAEATAGKSPYEYKFIVHNERTGEWYKIQDFSSKNTAQWYTGGADEKTLYVDVRDADGTVVRKGLSVNVLEKELRVTGFTSSEGDVLRTNTHTNLIAEGSKGTPPYEYKFIVHNEDSDQWYKIQDFSSENSCDWYTGPVGHKTLFVDIKDTEGAVVRKGLSVTVE